MCRNYIVFEDLLCFLPADKALTALKTLDGDGDGKVSPAEMRDAVLTIYKERKHLAATLSVRPPPRSAPTALGRTLAPSLCLRCCSAGADASVQDTRSVVGKMEATFAAIIHIVLVFFYLTVFQVGRCAGASRQYSRRHQTPGLIPSGLLCRSMYSRCG